MTKATNALILTALLAAAGVASAQVPTTTRPGEATTMVGGQSNPVDKSPKTSDTTRAEVRAEAAAANRNKANTTTMGGTASTVVNGKPNAIPTAQNPTTSGQSMITRDEKRAEGRAAAKVSPTAAETAK
ncbi:DUF4148 domain-containing protein [uncultured Xylophilus sp.]|uniref:DUF4148 domain-containing protein n=1 Tax=uncultured Xylophilus sp. TaxID=296832 RepID=UPI0025D2B5B0|nr:DUF4148 domain-containing protein [uncultured Xylophilus sp.]